VSAYRLVPPIVATSGEAAGKFTVGNGYTVVPFTSTLPTPASPVDARAVTPIAAARA